MNTKIIAPIIILLFIYFGLSIADVSAQFPAIAVKTVCDADFDPGFTSSLPFVYISSNTAVATIINGKVHITGSGTTLITADMGSSGSTKQTLIVSPLIVPSVTITPDVYSSCDGMEVTYTAMPVNAGNNPDYQWMLNGQVTGITTTTFTSNTLTNNDKITCIVTNNDQCRSVTSLPSNEASLVVEPYKAIALSITSSINRAVCSGTPITFTAHPSANSTGALTYKWQLNGQNVGSDNSTFSTNTLHDGDMVSCVMRAGGACILNNTVISNVIPVSILADNLCIIKVPTSFTPNSDGINDTWNINLLGNNPTCTVNIFNRYGIIVYQSTGYSNPWDGTSNAKPLPVGTYYYLIDPKKDGQKLSGSVTILR